MKKKTLTIHGVAFLMKVAKDFCGRPDQHPVVESVNRKSRGPLEEKLVPTKYSSTVGEAKRYKNLSEWYL